jgi:2-polyprenyl-6-hydroxyphenyl methylase/3-demethylubiquinone-9 3-methyltransferase
VTEASGERFGFGDNWSAFLGTVDERRVERATAALQRLTGHDRLDGLRFLDIGCGSGLHSLAACRLGAERIHSLDYDPASVRTTEAMRTRFAPDAAERWTIARGDVLDASAMAELGTWDVVYSWGVLHHTGSMWTAIEQAALRVGPGGDLVIAIYNDQGATSQIWTAVKRGYLALPPAARPAYVAAAMAPREIASAAKAVVRGNPSAFVRRWTDRDRGMSRWHDLVDWVGGYPFEVATPEAVFEFLHARGFALEGMRTCGGGLGNNEFRFRRIADR